MEKWICLCIITAIITVGISTTISEYNNTEKAKAGLEECRVDAKIIWVKDCKSILETKARLK